MPDVLNVPSGPGGHRPHRDYDDTRAYCAECLESWPCTAHQASEACAHCGSPGVGLPQFIVELRAARKVIEAVRPEIGTKGNLAWHAPTCDCPLCVALVAYDKAVG